MSRIDDLIAELCPDGVPHRALDQVVAFQKGEQLKAEDRIDGPYPVVTAGRTNESTHQEFNFGAGSVSVSSHGAYAGHINYWAEPIWLSNNVFLLAPSVPHLESRFLFFALKSRQQRVRDRVHGGGVPYLNARDLAPLRIPVPPLEVQREIVRVLDQFTQLEAELEAELEARRRQYEHYQRSLLAVGSSVENIPMGEIAAIGTGRTDRKDATADGAFPLYVRSKDVLASDKWEFDETAIILPGEGGIGEIFHFAAGKYALHQRAYRVAPHDTRILPRFLYFYLRENFGDYVRQRAVTATVTSLRRSMLTDFPVPLLPLEEQTRVVEALDQLDALVNDISVGLPAELAARRKQYEYYRDKLLTFEEAAA